MSHRWVGDWPYKEWIMRNIISQGRTPYNSGVLAPTTLLFEVKDFGLVHALLLCELTYFCFFFLYGLILILGKIILILECELYQSLQASMCFCIVIINQEE